MGTNSFIKLSSVKNNKKQFQMVITISENNIINTNIIDLYSGEEYLLHNIPQTNGCFVNRIRTEHNEVLETIYKKCFEPNVFKNKLAKEIIIHIKNIYNDELEFLWERFPNNAIWRRKDTRKWYGALLIILRRKLHIDSDETVEILNLREKPENVKNIIDYQNYFPGYHMNKKHWYTVCLNDSISTEELLPKIAKSYQLAI